MTEPPPEEADPVRGLLTALGSGDARRLSPWLDEDASWATVGLPTVSGRAAILRFWTRLLPRYRRVRVSLTRLAADGDIRVAEQTHLLDHADAGVMIIENMAVYRVEDGRIAQWTDHADLRGVPETEAAVWCRMRASA